VYDAVVCCDLSEDRGVCIFKNQVGLKIKAVRFFNSSETAHSKKLYYIHGEQFPRKRCCGTIKGRGDLVTSPEFTMQVM
jgi:hypothetical protein